MLLLSFWTVTQRRLVISYRRFGLTIGHILMGTLRCLSFPGILLGLWPLKNELVVCPETSAANYQFVLCNIQEEGRRHLHPGGSLKSYSLIIIIIIIIIIILRVFWFRFCIFMCFGVFMLTIYWCEASTDINNYVYHSSALFDVSHLENTLWKKKHSHHCNGSSVTVGTMLRSEQPVFGSWQVHRFFSCPCSIRSLSTALDIMIRLWVGQSGHGGSISDKDAKIFFLVKRLGPTQLPVQWISRTQSGRWSISQHNSPNAEVNTSGAVSPLPLCHHGLHIDDFTP